METTTRLSSGGGVTEGRGGHLQGPQMKETAGGGRHEGGQKNLRYGKFKSNK